MESNDDDVILQEHVKLDRITYHGWGETGAPGGLAAITATDTTVGQFVESLLKLKPQGASAPTSEHRP